MNQKGILLLIDWPNTVYWASHAISTVFGSMRTLYAERVVSAFAHVIEQTFGTERAVVARLHTSVLRDTHQLGDELLTREQLLRRLTEVGAAFEAQGILRRQTHQFQVLADPARVRSRSGNSASRTAEDDPVDRKLLQDAELLIATGRFDTVVLSGNDKGYIGAIQNDWPRAGIRQTHVLAFSRYEEQRNGATPGFIAEDLRQAVADSGGGLLIVDPADCTFVEEISFTRFDDNLISRINDGAEPQADLFADFIRAVRDAAPNYATVGMQYGAYHLTRRIWQDIAMDWLPHGFTDVQAGEAVQLLTAQENMRFWGGFLECSQVIVDPATCPPQSDRGAYFVWRSVAPPVQPAASEVPAMAQTVSRN